MADSPANSGRPSTVNEAIITPLTGWQHRRHHEDANAGTRDPIVADSCLSETA